MFELRAVCERGAVHRARGQRKQDRFAVDRGKELVFFAAADGHGGACYVRSGLGARFAVAAAAYAVRRGTPPEDFAAAVKDRFESFVAAHLARRPLTETEAQKAAGVAPAETYGTTLLGGALDLKQGKSLFFKLGDGDLNALDGDGGFLRLFEPDPACVGNLTASMVYDRETCLKHLAVKETDFLPAAVLVNTDGYRFTGETPAELAAVLCAEDPAAAFDAALQKGAHGDDLTVLLLYDPARCAGETFRTGVTARAAAQNELAALRETAAAARDYLKAALKSGEALWAAKDFDRFNGLRETVIRKAALLRRAEKRIALLEQRV